jgi:hypothetical protein
MTDQETSPPAGGGGRRPRQGVGGSPVGSTISIVLAVIAVIAGFLILRNITDDGGSDADTAAVPDGSDATESTIGDLVQTTTTAPTATTEAPFVTEGATVVVANANSVGGSAGRMTQALQSAGFTMGDPVNATIEVARSRVQFDQSVASAEAVAASVARVLGGVRVQPMPSPPPVDGESVDGGVLLLLGNNQADSTLEELSGGELPDAPTGTAPSPAGGADTATTAGG